MTPDIGKGFSVVELHMDSEVVVRSIKGEVIDGAHDWCILRQIRRLLNLDCERFVFAIFIEKQIVALMFLLIT